MREPEGIQSVERRIIYLYAATGLAITYLQTNIHFHNNELGTSRQGRIALRKIREKGGFERFTCQRENIKA